MTWRDLSFVLLGVFSFYLGYQWPRDLELESTAPVEIHYEVTPEAARYLVLKAVKGVKADGGS